MNDLLPLPPPTEYQALTFDAGGTLFHLAEPPGTTYARFAAQHGIHLQPEAATQAFKTAWKRLPRPAHTHPEPRPDDDAGWWRLLVEEVFSLVQIPIDQRFPPFFQQLYDFYGTVAAWELDPEALPLLRQARAWYKIGLLSNYDKRLRRLVTAYDIDDLFDFQMISSEIGADKPHPEIFQAAAMAAGVAPYRILHAGDDAECDAAGAQAAGFHSWLIRKPDRTLAHMRIWLAEGLPAEE